MDYRQSPLFDQPLIEHDCRGVQLPQVFLQARLPRFRQVALCQGSTAALRMYLQSLIQIPCAIHQFRCRPVRLTESGVYVCAGSSFDACTYAMKILALSYIIYLLRLHSRRFAWCGRRHPSCRAARTQPAQFCNASGWLPSRT